MAAPIVNFTMGQPNPYSPIVPSTIETFNVNQPDPLNPVVPNPVEKIYAPVVNWTGPAGPRGIQGPQGYPSLAGRNADYMTKNISNFAELVLADNPDRLGFAVVNHSESVDGYIGFSPDLVAGELPLAKGGLLITCKGGSFSTGSVRYTGPVYAITAAGSMVLSVVEFLP